MTAFIGQPGNEPLNGLTPLERAIFRCCHCTDWDDRVPTDLELVDTFARGRSSDEVLATLDEMERRGLMHSSRNAAGEPTRFPTEAGVRLYGEG